VFLSVVTRLSARDKIVVSQAETSHRSAWLEAAEWAETPAVSLRDWCDFQKLLQLRQFPHIAWGRLEAAFQFAHAAFKFGAQAWPYRDSGQSFAGRVNACRSHLNILIVRWLGACRRFTRLQAPLVMPLPWAGE
jgi:hypothetical protein